MKVLIGCEFSGAVRNAFRALGHDAWSCDTLPAEDGSPFHYQCDVREVLTAQPWDLGIMHPPCTYLTNSGVRWLYGGKGTERDPVRWSQMEGAAAFFLSLLNCPIPRIAVENPIMHGHAKSIVGRGPDQIVQPWQFGHGATKATGLWLRRLPPLVPTRIVHGREARVHRMPTGPDLWKERSRTFSGIAEAMAEQWGAVTPLPAPA
jgi:hypothetical protein